MKCIDVLELAGNRIFPYCVAWEVECPGLPEEVRKNAPVTFGSSTIIREGENSSKISHEFMLKDRKKVYKGKFVALHPKALGPPTSLS